MFIFILAGCAFAGYATWLRAKTLTARRTHTGNGARSRMKPATRTALWMGAAFGAALAVAVGAMVIKGIGPSGVGVGLRLTARLSFFFFWPAYVSGAVTTLFGPALDIMARRAREFGLAYASAQLVHVGLVIRLAWISPPQPLLDAVMPFFAIGIVWTSLLTISSMDRVHNMCSPYFLRVLRTIGLEYIALTFFTDFVVLAHQPLRDPILNGILYVPFWGMLVVGPLLRLAATVRRAYSLRPA